MKYTYAGLPSTVTLTWSSCVGRLDPLKSAPVQMRVVPERFAPLMVVQEPCENPGWKLPPFCTSVMVTPDNAPTGRASEGELEPPIERTTGKLPLGVVPGSWTVTWFVPGFALPIATALTTVTAWPPTVTVGSGLGWHLLSIAPNPVA